MFGLLMYVKSQSIIVNDQWTKKPKCICSVNTLLSNEEGKYLLDAQIRITQEFIQSQEAQKKKSAETADKDIEAEVTVDCVRNQSQISLSDDKLLQITRKSGKNLNEIYDKYSERFPDMYVPKESCSNDNQSVFAEKRSYDYMDSDSNGFESLNSTNTGSETSSLSVTEDEADSPKYRSPGLRDLLSDDKIVENTSCGINTSWHVSDQETNPILKGILKGNTNKEKVCSKIEKSVRNKDRSFADVANVKGASLEGSFTISRESLDSQGHAAAGHTAGVQSPTVDSSGPASSSADSSECVRVKSSVHGRFTSQLVMKHAMLKQTMDSQKITLEILKDQLQKSLNNVILNPRQKQVHDSLIEKITEAENQVVVQGQLLGELEHEILKQQM
ncbi:uncharacterized protein LOC132717375 [Ruditapes philippinarum]|uniref:uncharacterized protein LOC132717375 n=1 Tax=Ruditapes philippinarum TaxID=129788 RepID=UPI00295B1537|nr:uncharacterized protein LOC132717375 [Ruditapes philippinarum]